MCGFAIPYLCISVTIRRMLPEGSKATMQTLVLSIYAGLGTGFGAVAGGLMTDFFFDKNIRTLFQFSGMFVMCVVLALLVVRMSFTKKGLVFYQPLEGAGGPGIEARSSP